MAANVEIQIRAVDQSTAAIQKAQAGLTGFAKSAHSTSLALTEISSGIGLAKTAFAGIQSVVMETIGKTAEYAKTVQDLSRDIGATAEESSKLINAADDVGISAGTLSAALRAAIRNGTEPTIESIAQLADQYNELPAGIERTAFLMEKFGRQGAELGALMELGGEGIRKAGDEAERLGLVLSGTTVRQMEQFRFAIDNLGDSWDAFIYRISAGVVGPITDLLNGISKTTEIIEKNRAAFSALNALFGVIPGAMLLYNNVQEAAAERTNTLATSTDRLAGAQKSAKLAAEELTASEERVKNKMSELNLLMSGPVGKQNETYHTQLSAIAKDDEQIYKNMEKLNVALVQNQKELTTLEATPKPWDKKYLEQVQTLKDTHQGIVDKIGEQRTKLDENAQAVDNYAKKHQEASNRILFDLIAQKLSQDGLTEAEVEGLLRVGEKFGIVDKETIAMNEALKPFLAQLKNTQLTAEGVAAAISSIPKMSDFYINIHVNWEGWGGAGPANSVEDNLTKGNEVTPGRQPIAAAKGIDNWTVPAGYPNDSYGLNLALTSGEKVNVTPTGGGTTGGTTMNFFYQPTVSLGGTREAETVIAPWVRKVMREELAIRR